MPLPLNHLWRNVLLRPDERVRPEISNTATRVDEHHAIGTALHSCWRTAWLARGFRQVKVGKHNVAALVEEDVCVSE